MKSRMSKWGNSLALRIPKMIGSDLNLEDGTEVELSVQDGSIIITPVSSKYELEDLIRGITAENRHTETNWGSPRGDEVW